MQYRITIYIFVEQAGEVAALNIFKTMTDRLKGLTVVFTKPIREDDAECIINAIRMIKGVSIVHPEINTHNDFMAETRTKQEIRSKLYYFIQTEL